MSGNVDVVITFLSLATESGLIEFFRPFSCVACDQKPKERKRSKHAQVELFRWIRQLSFRASLAETMSKFICFVLSLFPVQQCQTLESRIVWACAALSVDCSSSSGYRVV